MRKKLSNADVRTIKNLVSSGTKQPAIARLFNIHKSTVTKIHNNKTQNRANT
jgi:DNA invertase Pin-like site-specific DNA recombinase